jgi:hypothetical protein
MVLKTLIVTDDSDGATCYRYEDTVLAFGLTMLSVLVGMFVGCWDQHSFIMMMMMMRVAGLSRISYHFLLQLLTGATGSSLTIFFFTFTI